MDNAPRTTGQRLRPMPGRPGQHMLVGTSRRLLTNRGNVVPESSQHLDRMEADILVGEKPHRC
jgi:hypothetical protein